jgi:hypothetical protein
VISAFASVCLAQKTNAPFLAVFQDGQQCIGWNASGGESGVVYLIEADGKFSTFSPGHKTIDCRWSLGDSRPVLQWLSETLNSPYATYMNVRMYSAAREATTREFNAMHILGGSLPGGDIELKESRNLELETYTAKADRLLAHELAHTIQQSAKKQKTWLCSNFKLRMGDLPTGNVVRTEKIHFRQEFGPTQATKKTLLLSDFLQDAPEVGYSTDDFSFYIPQSDRRVYDQEMVKALDGNPSLRTIEMDYLDENGLPMLTARMSGAIKSVGLANPFADPNDPDELVRVTYETLDTSPTTGSLELIIK